MSLIVTGTIGIDTIEVPGGERREGVLGGSAIYFAASASRLGPVRMVAAVGEDFPAELESVIAGFEGIDTSGLEKRAGSTTFRWGGKYLDNMDQRDTLFTELGVLEESPPPIPEGFQDSTTLFLANTHPGVQMTMLEGLPGVTLSVADTMDLWINVAKDDLLTLLTKVDGLVLNYEEAEQLTGIKNAVAAGQNILERGPTFVVVKKGEHGAILVHRDGLAALPAYPTVDVVDPTGAGDSFAGGMMARLAQTGDASVEGVRRAMAYGTVMASFNIETFSLDRLSTVTKDEIDARYNAYSAMLAV